MNDLITTNSYGTKFINIDKLPKQADDESISIYEFPTHICLFVTKDNGDVEEIVVKDWTRVRGGHALTYGNGSQVQLYKELKTAIRKAHDYLTFIKKIDANTVPTAQWQEA